MKPGLRLQILLLLGGLLLLTFVPLFFAVATYTSFTLSELRQSSARSLGRAIAGHVSEARTQRGRHSLTALLGAHIGEGGVEAIGIYDESGKAVTRLGEPGAVENLADEIDAQREAIFEVKTPHGRAIAVVVPDASGAVVAVLRTDDEAARASTLVQLVGLYMGLIALALLVLAYFALTRLLVRPLDKMSRAAERVAAGARQLEIPRTGARELVELGVSLRAMTERLMSEEEALRAKVDEVESATASLKEAQGRLVRSERLASVGRLAAGLAHEVGNPIAAIIGMQDLLIEGGLEPAEQRDFLERMRKETDRINSILRDLLQFARPGAERSEDGQFEPGNVETAIHDTVTLIAPQKVVQDVDLAVDVYPDLPNVVLGREQLVQVLLNLLLNAADACSTGGRVMIRAERSEGGVQITVEDDGTGVDPEVRDRLFEPFVTTKETGKGTGLGLAVCRGLIEAAGGGLTLDESHLDGARFVVELPVATP